MVTNNLTPNAELIAKQFDVQPLEARLEMDMPYGRDREMPTPSVPSAE